jgi:hypothetical protein
MWQLHPERSAGAPAESGVFVLYLEGAGDRGVLEGWARRQLPRLARAISRSAVILGGRQPARAIGHFRRLGGAAAGRRGLCVLDRDDGREGGMPAAAEPGLDFMTWGRRHIESYLLVPDAIERSLGLGGSDDRVHRVLRHHVPEHEDDPAWRHLDAKRLLGSRGLLARELGVRVSSPRIARAMRASELHRDVHALLARLEREHGVAAAAVVR